MIIVKPTNHTISGGGRFNISSQVNLTCTVIGVPLPIILWQLNDYNINIDPNCVLASYNVTLGEYSGFGNCSIIQTLDVVNNNVANMITDPQDIISLGTYELSELVVESNLMIESLQRSDNGNYTCNVTNMLPETDTISVMSGSTPIIVLGKNCCY